MNHLPQNNMLDILSASENKGNSAFDYSDDISACSFKI